MDQAASLHQLVTLSTVKFNLSNMFQLRKGIFGILLLMVDHVGWVSENFFARNTISVANDVSLVKEF